MPVLHSSVNLKSPRQFLSNITTRAGWQSGSDIFDAYITAREVDPVSAYGSVVSVNEEVTKKLAEEIIRTFVEVIVAPSFSRDALEIMRKKENMRVTGLPGGIQGR